MRNESAPNAFVNLRYVLFAMRGLTLLARFAFIIFIANQLSVIEVGFYGFISASIFVAVYMSGYEYGNYSARQIIKCKTLLCQKKVVSSLTVFGLMMFIVISPTVLLMTSLSEAYQYIPIVYFFLIVYGESYMAEHKKVLISLEQPFYAAVVDFVKSGVWAYLLIFLVLFGQLEIDLNTILLVWAVFVSIGAFLVFFKLRKLYNIVNFVTQSQFSTYKKQMHASTPFFLSGLSLLAIEISGRVSLQMAGLQTEAGVYTFYAGFIFAIPLFIWSASVAPDHAKILTTFKNYSAKGSDYLILAMTKRSLKICFLLSMLLFFSFDILLEMVNKSEYTEYVDGYLLLLFLLIPFLHVVDSHIYYMLYTRNMDKGIALSSIFGFVCLAIVQATTLMHLEIYSVISSVLIALFASVCTKLVFIFNKGVFNTKVA